MMHTMSSSSRLTPRTWYEVPPKGQPLLFAAVSVSLKLAVRQENYFEELQVPANVRFVRHVNTCYDW